MDRVALLDLGLLYTIICLAVQGNRRSVRQHTAYYESIESVA